MEGISPLLRKERFKFVVYRDLPSKPKPAKIEAKEPMSISVIVTHRPDMSPIRQCSEVPLFSTQKPGKVKKQKKFRPRCNICKLCGHFSEACLYSGRRSEMLTDSKGRRLCFHCQSPDHKGKECPMQKGGICSEDYSYNVHC